MIRNIIPALLALALCAPAHADAPGPQAKPAPAGGTAERLAPGDPLGYRPAPAPVTGGAAAAIPTFDPPLGGSTAGSKRPWSGAPNGWTLPVTALSRWAGSGVTMGTGTPPGLPPGWRPPDQPPHGDTPQNGVPGPAPVAVAAAAFTFSRKLRKRIHGTHS